MMSALANPFLWSFVIAGAALVRTALLYMASVNELANYIMASCPDLWAKIAWKKPPQIYTAEPLQLMNLRLDRLIYFDSASGDHPADPQFHKLLSRIRLSALMCFILFAIAIISLGEAGPLPLLDSLRRN